MERRTPLWLSHHYPGDYDRCCRVGWRHVCRRCLWFYPACFAVAAASVAGWHWPAAWDAWLLWLLPVPVVAEWWAEHLWSTPYAPRRQVVLSLVAAPAVGRGLGRYLIDPGDHLFWTVVISYALVCVVPLLSPRLRHAPTASGSGDAPELEGIPEERVAGDDPDRDPAPSGVREGQVGPVGEVAVDHVALG